MLTPLVGCFYELILRFFAFFIVEEKHTFWDRPSFQGLATTVFMYLKKLTTKVWKLVDHANIKSNLSQRVIIKSFYVQC